MRISKIKLIEKIKMHRTEFLLFFLVLFLNCFWIFFINAPYGMDEHGVLAEAAFLSGKYDWSACYSTSLPYYWGYGLAILYIPCFLIFNNISNIYKTCLFVNAVLAALIPVISYKIIPYVSKKATDKDRFLLSATIGVYPFYTFISKWTLNDIALIFNVWLSALIIVKLANNELEKTKEIILYILAGGVAAYAYAIHGRGLAILSAITLVIVLLSVFNKRKLWLIGVYLSSAIVILGIDNIIKQYLNNNLIRIISDETGNTITNILKYINPESFAWEEVKSIIKGALGQLYYSFISTFGLIIVFLVVFFALVYQIVKKRKMTVKETNFFYLSLFSIIAFGVSWAISVIFYSNVYATGEVVSREYYFYGRYIETIYPLCIFCLFILLIDKFLITKKQLIAIGILTILFLFIGFRLVSIEVLARSDLSLGFGSVATILGFAGKSFSTSNITINNFILLSVVCVTVLSILLMAFIKRKKESFFLILIVLFLYSSTYSIKNHLIPANESKYGLELSIQQKFENLLCLQEYNPNIYITVTGTRPIYYQLALPNYPIHYISSGLDQYKKMENIPNNSIIMSFEDEHFDSWLQDCYLVSENEAPYIWILGEETRKTLEDNNVQYIKRESWEETYQPTEFSVSSPEMLLGDTIKLEIDNYSYISLNSLYPGKYTMNLSGNNLEQLNVELTYNSEHFQIPIYINKTESEEYQIDFETSDILKDSMLKISSLKSAEIKEISVNYNSTPINIKQTAQVNVSKLDIPFNDYQDGSRTRFAAPSVGVSKNIWIQKDGYAYITQLSLQPGNYEFEVYGDQIENCVINIDNDIREKVELDDTRFVVPLKLENGIKNGQIRIYNIGKEIAYYQGIQIFRNCFDN